MPQKNFTCSGLTEEEKGITSKDAILFKEQFTLEENILLTFFCRTTLLHWWHICANFNSNPYESQASIVS